MELNAAQHIFLNKLDTKFAAYVGGFGSGKTFTGCLDQCIFFAKHPGTRQAYFGPSYPAIRDIFYPTMDEAAHMLGFRVEVRESNKEIHFYRGVKYYGTTICRSMDRPETIVGFKVSRALADEIDILKQDKADHVWNKIAARMRLKIDGVPNCIRVTTTPEGFKFTYNRFKNEPTKSYSMVQASTYENAKYLPDDYIDSLIETYPAELIDAYIDGEFVNLTSGTVFKSYNRSFNRSRESIKHKEPLFIGMDFNVTNMSGVVYVKRDLVWHAVEELKGIYDTPTMINVINEKYPEHNITVYPDASGKSRKSVDASTSDIALLQQAKYRVIAKESNPRVKDRIMAANAAFDKQRVMINDSTCTELARCLEQLAYDKNGEPDKSQNIDHLPDAGTYPIAFEMPIIKPMSRINVNFPM